MAGGRKSNELRLEAGSRDLYCGHMELDRLVQILDSVDQARPWLQTCGVEDCALGHRNLVKMAEGGLTLDLMAVLFRQLQHHLPRSSDPDMALNNLERFVSAARNPLSLGSLFERDAEALPTLLQIFSTSQYLADLLIRDPAGFDLLRITEGQPIARQVLIDEICSEVATQDLPGVTRCLRRYKHRETLRIAYGDIVRGQPLNVVTKQISFLADAICEAAVRSAWQVIQEKHGVPRVADGSRARFVVLALGKLGGAELNYSSDVDLIFLSDGDGKTDGPRPVGNVEFFDRLARQVVKFLTEPTELGVPFRVDLRLRPDGRQGPMVISQEAALRYYDVAGRTWERQAFVKARPIAGDLDLGQQFLEQLEPWIYRRYLSRADITGIKALKRRIEQRAVGEGEDTRNLKTGHGGIRDIEFVIQFLQLLNGGDLPSIRTGNTLQGIVQLEQAGCLTMQERSILEENYQLLRKIEHRLQIMFDLQTHTLPEEDQELRRLSIRLGYAAGDDSSLERFKRDLLQKTQLNRKILDHLLHDAFGDNSESEPESDLVLHPHPSDESIQDCLERYGFQDVAAAYRNLMALSSERIPFLSTRRCRHFLASIAPHLLEAIAATPDPDSTLVNLAKVSESLGGKGVLWELFSFSPPTLKLYVQLCAGSPYLSGILTTNPGMIDELMDSLVLDRLPTIDWLEQTLADLCRGAEDLAPILHSFKNAQHLRVGVRDILGKEDVRDTHRALSDIAEVCLKQIIETSYPRLVSKFGKPIIGDGPRQGEVCELVVIAMGKLGGREPNYHSDLDVVFLYEADGSTHRRQRSRDTTSNQHFFSQWAQRIIKDVTQLGPFGRLYELDPRLRPTGKSGALAVALHEFERYFAEGQGQLWERQALCKSRAIFGSAQARAAAMQSIRRAIVEPGWQASNAGEIRDMRRRLEESASPCNLKRGPGGTVDIEFIVQMLQLKHAARHPQVLVPGTLEALEKLEQAGALKADDAGFLSQSYRLLRSIETGLRLMNTTARHDLPQDPLELKKLAYLLGYPGPQPLLERCAHHTGENRRRFDRLCDQAAR